MEEDSASLPGPSGYDGGTGVRKRPRRKGIPRKLSEFADQLDQSSDEEVIHNTIPSKLQGIRPATSKPRVRRPSKNKRECIYEEFGPAEVEADVLLSRGDNGSVMWIPKDSHSLVSSRDDYRVITKLSRTVHLNEYFEIRKRGKLPAKALDEECETSICDDLRGIWFKAIRKDSHNKYGNVRFIIQLNTLLKFLEEKATFKFYLYEIYQSEKYCASRFIIAQERDHQIPGDMVPYDYTIAGGPWFAEINNKGVQVHKFVNMIRGYKSEGKCNVKHEVEFFLKSREDIYSELYVYVHPLPENHSEANESGGNCLRFQSTKNGCPTRCLYPFTKETTKLEIEEDWVLETFVMYTAWTIQKQVEEKLMSLGCNEETLLNCSNDMVHILVKIITQKARQMFAFVSNKKSDHLTADGAHLMDNGDNMTVELKEMHEVVNRYVDKYTDVLKDCLLSESTFGFMAASGKMEVHIVHLLDSMSVELYGIVKRCPEHIAIEMKNALNNEFGYT